MTISLNTGLRQSNRLAMTQSLKQAIELLQLSTTELYEKINQELIENPVLEEEPRQTMPAPEGTDGAPGIPQDFTGEVPAISRMEAREEFFSDTSDGGSINGEEIEKKRQALETQTIHKESLAEHLMEQARLAAATEDVLALYETIITSLDNNGFLGRNFKQLVSESGYSADEIERTLSDIQLFDPVGCAAAGVRESLIVQCRYYHPGEALLERILSDYFEDFERLNYKKIARSLNLPESMIVEKSRIAQELDPFPGRHYSNSDTRYVIPDVDVKLIDNDIVITVNDDWVPALRINPYYISLLNKKSIEKNLENYIQDKINSARNLIKNISGRRDTIQKVVRAIMDRQRDFLKRGPGHLAALTNGEVARKVSMHESTVSRVTSSKYVQTKWGVYSLKYFFVSRIKSAGRDRDASSDKAIRLIRDVVGQEKASAPYSDEEIVTILGAAGIGVARRTVAKYRGILGIPPSHKRRKINIIKSEEKT